MQNEDIKFCDYIKLKKQLEKIEKAMVSDYFSCNISLKKEPYKFDLFNCECSTGKTFSVVTKVVLFLEKWAIDIYNPKGMLFVMQNIAPCKYYANKINKELFDNNIIAETVDSDMDDVEIKNKIYYSRRYRGRKEKINRKRNSNKIRSCIVFRTWTCKGKKYTYVLCKKI